MMGERIVWTREESKERFPEPISPLGWSLLREPTQATLAAMSQTFGLRNQPADQVVKRIHGYVYTRKNFFKAIHPFQFRFFFWLRLVFACFAIVAWRSLAIVGERSLKPWFRMPVLGYFSYFIHFLRSRGEGQPLGLYSGDPVSRTVRSFFNWFVAQKADFLVKNWEATFRVLTEKFQTRYTANLDEQLTFGEFQAVCEQMKKDSRAYFSQDFNVYFLKSIYFAWIKAHLRMAGLSTAAADEILTSFVQGDPHNFSTKMAREFRVCSSPEALATLRRQYGHLTENWDIFAPVLGEREEFWNRLATDINKVSKEYRESLVALPARQIGEICGTQEKILDDVCLFQKLVLIDEDLRAQSSLQYPEIRRLFQIVTKGAAWTSSGLNTDDIYFLSESEVADGLKRGCFDFYRATIKARRAEFEKAESASPPFEVIEEADAIAPRPASSSAKNVKAQSVVFGIAMGPLLLVKSFDDLEGFRPGAIVAVKSPTPVFAPFYADSAAILSETGGLLSHGAIVAREYGIPMMVGIDGLFENFQTGDIVEVNADEGVVRLVNPGREINGELRK